MRRAHTTFEIDAILRRIARPQLGLVTIAQAAAAGVDKFALERRRESGALAAVFADVMRLNAVASTNEQRILAAARAVPKSVIAATSAAIVHAMPVGQAADQPVVSVGPSRSARTAGIVTIRQAAALPSQRWCATQLATPAASLLLLPRLVDDLIVERCLDHCLAHRLTTVATLSDLIEAVPSRSVVGRRLLLDLLAQRLSGIGHRSGLEQKVARWLNAAGLNGWQRNYRVRAGDDTIEVDFAWPEAKVALEVSPFFTHGSRATQERDAVRRQHLVIDGWRTVEATDPDVDNQRAFARTVASLTDLLLAAAGTSRALGSAQRSPTHNHAVMMPGKACITRDTLVS